MMNLTTKLSFGFQDTIFSVDFLLLTILDALGLIFGLLTFILIALKVLMMKFLFYFTLSLRRNRIFDRERIQSFATVLFHINDPDLFDEMHSQSIHSKLKHEELQIKSK